MLNGHQYGGFPLVALVILVGCSSEHQPEPESRAYIPEIKDDPPRAVVWDQVTEITNPLASRPQDSGESYEHKHSGVSVLFPTGWKVTVDESLHNATNVDFWRNEATVSITFYKFVAGSEAGLYEDKLKEYADMYGSKLKTPRQIKVGDKHGYQVQATPPLLYGYEPKTHHAIYSMFVVEALPQGKPRDEIEAAMPIRKWMICVSGYANEDKLDLVDEILHSIRWRRAEITDRRVRKTFSGGSATVEGKAAGNEY